MGNHTMNNAEIDAKLIQRMALAMASLALMNCGQATEISPLRSGLAQPKLAVVTDDEVVPTVETEENQEAPKIELPKDLGDLLKAK